MKNSVIPLVILQLLLVAACSPMPTLVSLESSLSNPQLVTIYKDPA